MQKCTPDPIYEEAARMRKEKSQVLKLETL
jgi:hypothetical protein